MFSLMPRRRGRGEGNPLATREYSPFDLLRREFGPLFDRVFPAWPAPMEFTVSETEPWRFEMEELDREYVVRAELPGFAPGEVEVRLTGDVLTIRAEHTEPAETAGKERPERRHGLWERSFSLPPGIAPERIEARCHHGVLEVHLPKAPEIEPRRIEVKT